VYRLNFSEFGSITPSFHFDLLAGGTAPFEILAIEIRGTGYLPGGADIPITGRLRILRPDAVCGSRPSLLEFDALAIDARRASRPCSAHACSCRCAPTAAPSPAPPLDMGAGVPPKDFRRRIVFPSPNWRKGHAGARRCMSDGRAWRQAVEPDA
jgi:hypothetical protein